MPIVFIGIADAIAQGFVHSLAHPDGNLTGLTMYEASVSGKYLSMLKEIDPQLTHAAFVANPKTAPYYEVYLEGAKVAAPSLGIEPVLIPIENDSADVERAIIRFARAVPKGSLVVVGDSTTNAHRDLIISLAAQAATKFETLLNIKTAKALGLAVPAGLLVAADQVIE
jgi:putative tryptophan/tyrosine transport system substrate-binding protein